MYFIETSYTHRGIITKKPKNPAIAEKVKVCKKFEAGDHLCKSNSNVNVGDDIITPSKLDCDDILLVSDGYSHSNIF